MRHNNIRKYAKTLYLQCDKKGFDSPRLHQLFLGNRDILEEVSHKCPKNGNLCIAKAGLDDTPSTYPRLYLA